MALLPIFPLDVVLFPGIPLPLHIFEPRYKEMIGECLAAKAPFGMLRAQEHAVAPVGCTAEIVNVVKRYDDGRLDILTEGRRRFEVVDLDQERAFLRAEVLFFEDDSGVTPPESGKARELHTEMMAIVGGTDDLSGAEGGALSFRLAASLPTDLDFKQTLLAMRSEGDRIALLIDYYNAVIPKLKLNAAARIKASGNGHVR